MREVEQRAIAAALSDVDTLIGALDKLIAKKRCLKQAAVQQLLTGQTRLPGFSGEWEVERFDSVLNRVNAKAHQIQTSDYQPTGKYPVVDQGKQPVIGFSDRDEKRFRCPVGGVIVFGDHTCFVKFVDFDFLVGADGTQILHASAGQDTRFHAYQLQYRGVEATGYNRHFKFLMERDFLAPSLSEQTAIAAVLSDMDAELAASKPVATRPARSSRG
jgi:type I restriction enzyme, S subunit